MWDIFLQTLPFFGLIAVGYAAGRTGFFSAEATAYLTKFVFYFALSAMLFGFSSNLSLAELFDWSFVAAYLFGSAFVYLIAVAVALFRRLSVEETAIEAHCAVIGNVGFLGIPMLTLLLGPAAVGPNLMVLAVDLLVFGTLVVVLITGSRDGRMSLAVLGTVGRGIVANPMLVSIFLGLTVSTFEIPIPGPLNEFMGILGAAATPCALFAIGASLASKSAERVAVAGWLSVAKLVLHPAAVAFAAFLMFDVDPYAAGVMVAAAALPVAGNVYIVAQHYGVAPHRVSASILISTVISVLTVSGVIALVAV